MTRTQCHLAVACILLVVAACGQTEKAAVLNLQATTANGTAATTQTPKTPKNTAQVKAPPEYRVRELFNWPESVMPTVPPDNRRLWIRNVENLITFETNAGFDLVATYTLSGTPTPKADLARNYEKVVFVFRKR